MEHKFLIRLDDACPTMNHDNWLRMFQLLDSYNIRPMVGIIPHNKDSKQQIDAPDLDFWSKANSWSQKGYTIALHGYNHCYISESAGLNPLWHRSEFAGVKYELQCKKIEEGYSILKEHGILPKYFFAPSHTFDENTLKALKEFTDIRIISDTIATKPYRDGDFIFIPQIGGKCKNIKFPGIWTFCLHPSTMKDSDFLEVERFLIEHKNEFISFDQIDLSKLKKKDLVSRILSNVYFFIRKIRGKY